MRPLFGDTPPQGVRASDSGAPQHPAGPQMTYFLRDEAGVDATLQQSLASLVAPREPRKQQQQQQQQQHEGEAVSIDSAPGSPSKHVSANDRDGSIISASSSVQDCDEHPDDISFASDVPIQKPTVTSTPIDSSRPLTPLMLGASGPASAISGVSSRRNSVTASLSEETTSQALGMSVELEPDASASMMDSGSAPQLVMPSIKMPSRRPFTDEGKRLGRLKVLVAGDSGIGKTSLIKAIVQTADAIVHVDPITPTPQPLFGQRSSIRSSRRAKSSKNGSATNQIIEISASTKPYPEWWSDLDDFRLLKRRKSLGGDAVLDRNICFIDTPGYSDGSSCMETITPVIRHVESQFEKVQSNTSTDPDMLGMLGGDGGSQVDAVLYLIQNKLKPADLKYLQQLAPLTNVIPLLAQADTLTAEAVKQSKERIRSELVEAGVRPFSFTTLASLECGEPTWLYAISSLPGSDHDIMDASLLMSPDYVQPLISSELALLVEQMFCENGASWLRHASAKKYLQWKKSDNPSRPRALYRSLTATASPVSNSLVTAGPMTYSLARITDHTQREERLAQIRLANWASDLQRSIANEKTRYEALAHGERAIWLTEKLSECAHEGTLVPIRDQERSVSGMRGKTRRKGWRGSPGTATMEHQDPLGLLEVAAKLRVNGWVALEVLGGMGLLGGVAIWASKSGWHVQAVGWAVDSWSAFWNNDR